MERSEDGQKGIESFFLNQPTKAIKKRARSPSPVAESSRSASVKTKSRKTMNGDKTARPKVIDISDDDETPTDKEPDPTTTIQYTCDRCSKRYSTTYKTNNDDKDGAEIAAKKLEEMKRDHADWHVARDLYEEDRTAQIKQSKNKPSAHASSSKTTSDTKKAKKPDIKAFFAPSSSTQPTKKRKTGGN